MAPQLHFGDAALRLPMQRHRARGKAAYTSAVDANEVEVFGMKRPSPLGELVACDPIGELRADENPSLCQSRQVAIHRGAVKAFR